MIQSHSVSTIYTPNKDFNFSNIVLDTPINLQEGVFFTKISYLMHPLYIQTPKSTTKQGFIKTGKKISCDLMFDNQAESFIQWMETLEETCQECIFKNREDWFQEPTSLTDIENTFTPTIKLYKSGKFFLLKTTLKNNVLNNEPIVLIYDESHRPLTMEAITNTTNFVSIIEIKGIRFSSKSFQIEIELTQAMVIGEDEVYHQCLIKSSTSKKPIPVIEPVIDEIELEFDEDEMFDQEELNTNNIKEKEREEKEREEKEREEKEREEKEKEKERDDDNEIDIDNLIIQEDEPITLKQPNEVYRVLYQEAKKKAILAKKQAIQALLEAKHIKNTFLLSADSDNEADTSDEDEGGTNK